MTRQQGETSPLLLLGFYIFGDEIGDEKIWQQDEIDCH